MLMVLADCWPRPLTRSADTILVNVKDCYRRSPELKKLPRRRRAGGEIGRRHQCREMRLATGERTTPPFRPHRHPGPHDSHMHATRAARRSLPGERMGRRLAADALNRLSRLRRAKPARGSCPSRRPRRSTPFRTPPPARRSSSRRAGNPVYLQSPTVGVMTPRGFEALKLAPAPMGVITGNLISLRAGCRPDLRRHVAGRRPSSRAIARHHRRRGIRAATTSSRSPSGALQVVASGHLTVRAPTAFERHDKAPSRGVKNTRALPTGSATTCCGSTGWASDPYAMYGLNQAPRTEAEVIRQRPLGCERRMTIQATGTRQQIDEARHLSA